MILFRYVNKALPFGSQYEEGICPLCKHVLVGLVSGPELCVICGIGGKGPEHSATQDDPEVWPPGSVAALKCVDHIRGGNDQCGCKGPLRFWNIFS